MYERVCWHPANRAMTAMVKYCITRLLAEGFLDFPVFLEATLFSDHGTALEYLHSLYSQYYKSEPISPIAYLLEGERSIYREVLSYSVQKKATGKGVAEPLSRLTVFEVAELEDILARDADRRFPLLHIRPGEILLDVPTKDRSRPSGERGGSVIVYEGNSYGRGVPLERETPVAKDSILTHETRSKVCRVFVSRRLAAMLDGQSGRELLKHLRENIAERMGSSDSSAIIT